ncbi:hypothetical protein HanLR1_Chr16g0607461 [Helianthus annuus]|nr:hypothetical protein HanLR1_Chr16g0607461 [Helianthus annuus]
MHKADHPVLKFEPSTSEWNKYDKLNDTDLLQHRVIDWLWLSEIGAKQEVRDLLGQRLINVLECIEPQYEELVLEFHSTWAHKEGKFEQGTTVLFSLGRQVYEMNMASFSIVSGLYTEEEVKRPEFVTYLQGAYSKPRDCGVGATELREFWSTISDHPFTTTNLITSVRNPVYMYVLKILSTTLVGRKSGETYHIPIFPRITGGPSGEYRDVVDIIKVKLSKSKYRDVVNINYYINDCTGYTGGSKLKGTLFNKFINI